MRHVGIRGMQYSGNVRLHDLLTLRAEPQLSSSARELSWEL